MLYKNDVGLLMKTLARISHMEPKYSIDPIRMKQLILLKKVSAKDLYEKAMIATFFPTSVTKDIPLSFATLV